MKTGHFKNGRRVLTVAVRETRVQNGSKKMAYRWLTDLHNVRQGNAFLSSYPRHGNPENLRHIVKTHGIRAHLNCIAFTSYLSTV